MIDFTTGFGGSLIDHGLGVASGCTRLGLQGIARLVGGLVSAPLLHGELGRHL